MEEPLPENIRGGSSQVHRERNLLTKPSYRIFLQNGISECVYQRIQLFAGFAERAGAVVIVGIIRHISFAEYGADRNVIYLVHGTENGRYSLQQAAVILDTFDGLIDRPAGGNRSHKNDHVLIADHGYQIFTEDDLAVVVEFGVHHIDRLVHVHGMEAAVGQLL